MTFTDSPDWEEVAVTVAAAGDMPDAPDWQRTVVGPAGAPIGGGALTYVADDLPSSPTYGAGASPNLFYVSMVPGLWLVTVVVYLSTPTATATVEVFFDAGAQPAVSMYGSNLMVVTTTAAGAWVCGTTTAVVDATIAWKLDVGCQPLAVETAFSGFDGSFYSATGFTAVKIG